MSTERLPTVYLYFRFYGESFDPDDITRRLGLEPTLKFRPGDPVTENGEDAALDKIWKDGLPDLSSPLPDWHDLWGS